MPPQELRVRFAANRTSPACHWLRRHGVHRLRRKSARGCGHATASSRPYVSELCLFESGHLVDGGVFVCLLHVCRSDSTRRSCRRSHERRDDKSDGRAGKRQREQAAVGDALADPYVDTRSHPDPELSSNGDTKAQLDADSQAERDSVTDCDPDATTERNVCANAIANSQAVGIGDTDTCANRDADGQPKRNADACSLSDSNADARAATGASPRIARDLRLPSVLGSERAHRLRRYHHGCLFRHLGRGRWPSGQA